jgi:hypothetical protein
VPTFYDVRHRADGSIEAFVPVPESGAPVVVKKAALKTTDAVDPPTTSIFTPDTELGSRFLIEVVRGCANLCRFCWAGVQLPSSSCVSDRVGSCSLPETRDSTPPAAGLVSIALCDHPEIEEILTRLVNMGYSISPASLRLDDLTPSILELLRRSGERTITIAPETGSDRLRRVINKTVTNDEILAAADMIFASGLRQPEAYFMIGLPTETDDDLVAIVTSRCSFANHAASPAQPRPDWPHRRQREPLVPKPGTTYQWLPMEDDRSIDRKIKRMRSLMGGIDNVYFNIKSERHSFYQALLSLGDRRVAAAIEAAERNGGNWRAAVAETGVDADFFVFRDRSADKVLPWDIIGGGPEGPLLPLGVRQGTPRRVDAPAKTAEGERTAAAVTAVTARPLDVRRGSLALLVRGCHDGTRPPRHLSQLPAAFSFSSDRPPLGPQLGGPAW